MTPSKNSILNFRLLLIVTAISFVTAEGHGQSDVFLMKDDLPYLEHLDTALSKVKKDKIYQLTKQWIAKTFDNSKAVIDLDDPNSGTLIIKYRFDTQSMTKLESGRDLSVRMNNKATMQIDCRDSKIRIRTSEFQQSMDMGDADYQFVSGAIQRLQAKGGTIESISRMDVYRNFISAVNVHS